MSARRGRRGRGRRSTEGAGRPARRSRARAAGGGIGARPWGAEPASLASEESHGGRAPGGPPEQRRMPHEELPSLQRPRYGCECAGSLWSWGTPLAGTALGRPRGAGCALRRAATGKVGKWDCKATERLFPPLSSKFLIPASSHVPPPCKPQRRGRRSGCGLGVSGEELA